MRIALTRLLARSTIQLATCENSAVRQPDFIAYGTHQLMFEVTNATGNSVFNNKNNIRTL
jgi:hypothetical protein